MNKLTGRRQTVEWPNGVPGTTVGRRRELTFRADFVRIRMILRAPPKPVKRRSPRKLPLPNKSSSLFINRAASLEGKGPLARLYANGIFGSV
jgi:hypothetical protein